MSSPRTSALTCGNARSASTAALTKNDMKPSLTPCFFWNASPQLVRRSATALMSTSLNVVSSAVCCVASTSRLAIARRHMLMWTISSARSAPSVVPGGIVGRGASGRGAGVAAAALGDPAVDAGCGGAVGGMLGGGRGFNRGGGGGGGGGG